MEHGQQPHNVYNQTGGGTNNPQMQGVNQIAPEGNFIMGGGSTIDKSKNTADSKSKVGGSTNDKSKNTANSKSKEHSQQPHNVYNQTGGGTNNPQMQGVDKIVPKGDFIMLGGSTNDKSKNTADSKSKVGGSTNDKSKNTA